MRNILSRRSFLGSGAVTAGLFSAAGTRPAIAEQKDSPQLSVGPTLVNFVGRGQAQYAYTDVPFKPCIRRLETPSGLNVLRDAPEDHLHHHALMFAMGVNDTNFWEEHGDQVGRQRHLAFSGMAVDETSATVEESLQWEIASSKKVLLTEQRQLTLAEGGAAAPTFLEWKSAFKTGEKTVRLEGAHYYGLGMRFLKSMDQGGRFLNPTGEKGERIRGDERNLQAPWCAYLAKAEDKPVTAAMFSHPETFRHPATFFTMGNASPHFAYLSATLNLYKEGYVLKRGEILRLHYAVALWDGFQSKETIEEEYQHWINATPDSRRNS